MITRVEGMLESVDGSQVVVAVGDTAYEISVPSADVGVLFGRVGGRVTLHTLHYLESQGQGASFWPKLIGFQSAKDRAFFELVTTVKGIGVRRALRALTIPFPRIAEAIVMKDLALLTSLPEIGRKTAETMVLELRDKVDAYAAASRSAVGGGGGAAVGAGGAGGGGVARTAKGAKAAAAAAAAAAGVGIDAGGGLNAATVMDAVGVLVQLGESRSDARALIDKAIERDAALATADGLVAAALASKGLAR